MTFDGIAILLLPIGLLYKFVIVFVTPYFLCFGELPCLKRNCAYTFLPILRFAPYGSVTTVTFHPPVPNNFASRHYPLRLRDCMKLYVLILRTELLYDPSHSSGIAITQKLIVPSYGAIPPFHSLV